MRQRVGGQALGSPGAAPARQQPAALLLRGEALTIMPCGGMPCMPGGMPMPMGPAAMGAMGAMGTGSALAFFPLGPSSPAVWKRARKPGRGRLMRGAAAQPAS
jgi:hypothetical protein